MGMYSQLTQSIFAIGARLMSLFKDKLRVNYKGGSRFRENDNSLGVEMRKRLKAGIVVLSIAEFIH